MAEEGLKIKVEMMQRGKELKEQRQADLEAKKAEKEKAEQEVEDKRAVKDAAEVPEKEALDVIRAEEERERAAREAAEKAAKEQEALAIFDGFDTNKDGQVTREEIQSEIKLHR